MEIAKYEVTERPLTVGGKVLSVGRQFTENDWAYGKEAIEAAIKNGRCKVVTKKEQAKAAAVQEKAESKKDAKAGK